MLEDLQSAAIDEMCLEHVEDCVRTPGSPLHFKTQAS